MNNFIVSSYMAQILDKVPVAHDYLCDTSYIEPFGHIREFGKLKMKRIVPDSLGLHLNKGIEICYVREGRYKWIVEHKTYDLYPGDCFITSPWQKHGSPQGVLDIGSLNWIIISPEIFSPAEDLKLGKWSSLSPFECSEISDIYLNNSDSNSFRSKETGRIFDELQREIFDQDLGYKARVNGLTDELLVETARALKKQTDYSDNNSERDQMDRLNHFLQNQLHRNLKTEELAAQLDMGQTSFYNFIRRETGFSPHQYLLHLRVEAAQIHLKQGEKTITDIAIESGFYSSQHFANVFRARTGFSPREYRKLFLNC
ncbi:MAG: AraC family transcriptional regulator [Bacteroidetes bacterium]|nr:AraC family transcriptional regulator [Bacteroidota bacterium]